MNLTTANIPEFQPRKIALPEAPFLAYQPDFNRIKHLAKEFNGFKNILVIGNGGSVTSFIGIYNALGTAKNVAVISGTDPEYISEIKNKFHPHETLVITISKSGENITQLETTLQFLSYPLLVIASKGNPLEQLGQKAGARIVEHPVIGGRYTGITEVALLPAAICGIDVEAICTGAKEVYELYQKENLALKAAQIFFELEQHGYVDVFLPIYSHQLFPFSSLIVQLCHESFGKAGLGQSYLAAEAPESQHHTNQRFFGGRKNIAGFFIHLENFRQDAAIIVPPGMQSIPVRDGNLFNLNKIPLSYSMQAEFHGTLENAKIEGIPLAVLDLTLISPEEIGRMIAFWQLFAIYSSVLRGVNPFDQPEVENSKKLSWKKRRDLKS